MTQQALQQGWHQYPSEWQMPPTSPPNISTIILGAYQVKTIKGKGFLVLSTQGSVLSDELDTFEEAVAYAHGQIGSNPAGLVIVEACSVIRPKQDVIATHTKRGAELAAQVPKALLSGKDEVQAP